MTSSFEIARFLGLDIGKNFEIDGVSGLEAPRANTVSFVRVVTPASEAVIAGSPNTLFLVATRPEEDFDNILVVSNPRKSYAMVVDQFFGEPTVPGIANSARVDAGATVSSSAQICEGAVIASGVVVGGRTVIGPNTVLHKGVRIGENCRVGANTSIGGVGFGFELDDDGEPIRIPHLGGVRVGDRVEIGSLCSIARGTIGDTSIESGVKIDDHVFVAHNVSVGANSYLIAGSEVSGGVEIGANVWISPQVAVINKVKIGEGAMVGIGSVVIRDVEPGTLVVGVPAKSRGARP